MPLGVPPAGPCRGKPPNEEHDALWPVRTGLESGGDVCTESTPDHGRAGLKCEPCLSHANAHGVGAASNLQPAGGCRFAFTSRKRPAAHQEQEALRLRLLLRTPAPGRGAPGEPEPCDPVQSSDMQPQSRVAAFPDGTPSRCGFYFPPRLSLDANSPGGNALAERCMRPFKRSIISELLRRGAPATNKGARQEYDQRPVIHRSHTRKKSSPSIIVARIYPAIASNSTVLPFHAAAPAVIADVIAVVR